MALDKETVAEEWNDLDLERFNQEYLMAHRPFVLRGYALDWPATEKWPTLDYLVDILGPLRAKVFRLNLT